MYTALLQKYKCIINFKIVFQVKYIERWVLEADFFIAIPTTCIKPYSTILND